MNEGQKRDFLNIAFRSFLENSPDMIFIKDKDLVYVAASRTFAGVAGFERPEELVGKTDFDFFPPELAKKYTEDDRMILREGTCVENYIEPLPDQEGTKSYSSTSKYVIRGSDGEIIGLYGVARDVTAEVALDESSRLSRQLFDSVLEADLTEDRVLGTEGSGWAQYLNIAVDGSFTKSVAILADRNVHPDYVVEFRNHYDLGKLKREYKQGIDEFKHVSLLRGAEDYRWVEFRTQIYHSRVSNTLRMTTFLKDVDEDVRRRQQLQKRATTDALTGLFNREGVLENISRCLKKSGGQQTHALLFIDLDSFKQVNDSWGHQLGDKVLQQTAQRLQCYFRREDVLGRIGGDEFLAFMRDVPSRQAVEDRARRIVEELPFRYREDAADVRVTYSIGVAFCKGDDTTVERLYEQADRAMYRAKERGRDQVFFYDDIG